MIKAFGGCRRLSAFLTGTGTVPEPERFWIFPLWGKMPSADGR